MATPKPSWLSGRLGSHNATVPKAKLGSSGVPSDSPLSLSQQATLNPGNLIRSPPSNTSCIHSEYDKVTRVGAPRRRYFRSVGSVTSVFVALPPFLSLLSEAVTAQKQKTGKAGFLFNLLALCCVQKEKGTVHRTPGLLCPLLPFTFTLLPLAKSINISEGNLQVNCLLMGIVLWGLLLTTPSSSISIHKDLPCVSWTLVWETEKRDRRASQWLQDRCRACCDPRQSKFSSLEFSKHGNSFLGLGPLRSNPRAAF